MATAILATCAVVGAVANLYGMVKTYDDIKDNTRKREIDLNNLANISSTLSEEERENFKRKRESILDKYPEKDKIPENDLWELARIETLMNGNKCDIKDQTKLAVENIKNVEMKQNIFENQLQNFGNRLDNVELTVKHHGEILANHENRIGRLENTVDLHSRQISVLQSRVDNHEHRIGKLEVTVNMHTKQINELRNTVDIHTQQISFLNNKVNENSKNIQILNERTNQIQQNVCYLNNAVHNLGNELINTNKRMESGFNTLQNNIIQSHDILHNEKTHEIYTLPKY